MVQPFFQGGANLKQRYFFLVHVWLSCCLLMKCFSVQALVVEVSPSYSPQKSPSHSVEANQPITEALQQMPGLNLKGDLNPGGVQQLSLFAMPGSSCAVLFEDIILNGQNSGGVNLAHLNHLQVTSACIQTLSPHPFYQGAGLATFDGMNLNRPYTHEISTEASSLGSIQAQASTIIKAGQTKVGLMAAGILDDGIPQKYTPRQRGALNAFQAGSLGIKLETPLDLHWRLESFFHHKASSLETDGAPPIPTTPQDLIRSTLDLYKIKALYDAGSPYTHAFWYGGYHEKNQYTFNQSTSRNSFTSHQLGYQGQYQVQATTSFMTHVDQTIYQTTPQKQYQDHLRIFLGHTEPLTEKISLEVAALGHIVTHHGTRLGPQVAVIFDLPSNIRWHISYKQTHRYPTLIETASIPNIQIASPHLKAERSHVWQSEWQWTPTPSWQVTGSLFKTQTTNAINALLIQQNLYQKTNQNNQTWGGTASVNWQRDMWQIQLNYTQTHIGSTGLYGLRLGIARHQGRVLIRSHITPQLSVQTTVNLNSKRPSQKPNGTRTPTPVRLSAYELLAFKLNYQPAQNLNLYITLKNALNKKYQTLYQVRTPGRAIHVGIHGRF